MTETSIEANECDDQYLTFAEAGEIIGANTRSVRLAVREGLLAAVPGEDGESRVTRAAIDELVPPIFQRLRREWRKYEHNLMSAVSRRRK